MITLAIKSDEPLVGSTDVESIARDMPRTDTRKGVFFRPLVAELGGDMSLVRARLVAPPRADRYLPFHDYPHADYVRLSAAVASRRFPDLGLREALRRVARDDFAVLAHTLVGKVLLAMAGDARSALLRAQSSRLAKGGIVSVQELDSATVRIEFQNYICSRETTLGQLEGVVIHYGGKSVVTVHDYASNHVAFDVRHKGA